MLASGKARLVAPAVAKFYSWTPAGKPERWARMTVLRFVEWFHWIGLLWPIIASWNIIHRVGVFCCYSRKSGWYVGVERWKKKGEGRQTDRQTDK